jgi:hypothetical protein
MLKVIQQAARYRGERPAGIVLSISNPARC